MYRDLDEMSLRHIGGWVGGHFKTFAQIAPLFLAGSGRRKNLLRCLLSTATLFKLVYRRPNLPFDVYVKLVAETVDQLLYCAQSACSLVFQKYKIHLLLHLPQHLRLFTSLPDVSTEVEESLNGQFRKLYGVCSGRKKVESSYIARRIAERESYLHFSSGGYIPDEDTGLLRVIPPPLRSNLAADLKSLPKSESQPSHAVNSGDFIFGKLDGVYLYGKCVKLKNNVATITSYELVQVEHGFLLDELGNLSLTKKVPLTTITISKNNITVLKSRLARGVLTFVY